MLTNFNFHQRYVILLCATSIALVAITILYALWQWHDDWQLTQQSTVVKSVSKSNNNGLLISAIPSEHIFGQSLSEGNMPISNLQLSVTGIVKATNASDSKVYISMAGEASKVFAVGESLPYGVKIYAITNDAVILKNDERLERLPLMREKLEFKPLMDMQDRG